MTAARRGAESAHAYLDAALTIVERHALVRDSIDWVQVKDAARRRCASADGPVDTYGAITRVLSELDDGHSFFSPPGSGAAAIASGAYAAEVSLPSGSIGAVGAGHVTIPAFRGSATDVIAYAERLRELITGMADEGVTGWIVDLAGNTGGNMLPMLAGLGLLLGEGVVGHFTTPGAEPVPWALRSGCELWIGAERVLVTSSHAPRPRLDRAPVAVVVSGDTASSGEAVAIAFVGRVRSRSFGCPTRGLTTSNEVFELSDGASIALTVARFASRDGRSFAGPLVPDQAVLRSGADAVGVATDWLEHQRTLRESR